MNSEKLSKGISFCPRNSKSKTGVISTRVPTIKCHEEVMSKLSSCTHEECIGDPDSCVEKLCHHKQKNKKNKIRTVSSKCKPGLHQSVSVPGHNHTRHKHKDLHPQTAKSKSEPIVQTPNFEDSIDFIPVKLISTNDHKQKRPQKIKHNFESKEKKASGPTWDEILRYNLEVVSRPDKSTLKKSPKSGKYNNCYSERPLSGTPRKKVSLKESNSCHEQEKIRQACGQQRSELLKTSESSKSEELPIGLLQHVDPSDPVKTLDFLIRQLRDGLVKQSQKDSLQNIILDMENALLKISHDKNSHSKKEIPVHSAPQSVGSTISHEKVRNKHLDILQLEQNLERSCQFLQSLCIKQKENCSNHMREKEQLSLQLAESRRLLAVSKSKEKNYEVTIGDLRLKLQEANTKIDQSKHSLQDLQEKNATLTEENKAMTSLKESLKKVGVRLKQIASEKEKLQSKLSLKDLEIEKLKVLLQMKCSQHSDPKEDNKLIPNENNVEIKISDDNDLSILSLPTMTSWSEHPGLMCSSQASSTPRDSPSPYNSWQHISSIVQQPSAANDINRGIINILQDLKIRSEQMEPLRLELQNPSSCSSLWSDREAVISKVIYSDGESGSFSS